MSDESIPICGDAPAEPPVRLGLLLRKAREARGLTVDDVVLALKFRARQIEALEADELPVVAGDVFSRGLVRSYARLVRLDPEPLLALLEANGPVDLPEVREPENMGTAMPNGGWRRIPPLILVSLALLVVAGGLAAWHFLVPISLPGFPAVATRQESRLVEAATPAQTAMPVQEAQVVANPTLPATAPEVADAGAPMQPPAAPVPAVPFPEGGKKLVFDFRGKSWVEVKDASQRVIFTGQYFAGNHEVLAGKPPLQVVVGNANDVQVEFDGHSIDLRPYTRAEVARLTLE